MKIIKTIVACVLCVALSCGMLVLADSFAGYTPISTKEELRDIANNLNGSYYLTQDIVFTDADFMPGGAFYNEGSGWLPIGPKAAEAFKGVLDGNGHKISGLVINAKDVSGSFFGGLIGYSKGTVKNLVLESVNINVQNVKYAYVGAAVGSSSIGNIENCLVTGDINVSGVTVSSCVGGISGGIYSGNIIRCENRATVTSEGSTINAGGIAGMAYAPISECANTGAVCATGRGDIFAGGIVGAGKAVTDCFNIGSVKGSSKCDGYAGGIIGRSEGNVTDCYNAGVISLAANTYEYRGGVSGYVKSGAVSQCYYLSELADSAVGEGSGSAVALTPSDFYKQSAFANLDFENKWTVDGKIIRPKALAEDFPLNIFVVSFSDYTGKEIAVRLIPEGEVIDEVQYPTDPQRTGYSTIGWSSTVNIPVTQDMPVEPLYEKDASYIYNVDAGEETVIYPQNQDFLFFEDRVTVEATKNDFSYWKIGDTVVSDKARYSFLTMGNVNIEAVYGAEAPAPQVFLHSDAITTELLGFKYKFSMVGSSYVPEGYTLVEAGILLAEGDRSGDIDSFIIDSADFKVVKRKVSAAYTNSQFMITLTNVNQGLIRSGRAYMIVADSEGNEITYYSSTVSVASFS